MTLRAPVSRVLDLDGPVHVLDHGGPRDLPTVLCVHGLGSSSVSWRGLARALRRDHRVVAVDLPGHGRSPRAGRSAGMEANAALLGRVMEETGPAVVVGHSMGAALALKHSVARPSDVAGLVLLAPPMPRMPWEPMTPELALRVVLCAWPWLARATIGARFRRLGAEEFVRRNLALTCASAETVDEEVRQMLIQRAESGGADDHATFVEAARSVGLLVARAGDYRRSIAAVTAPGLVLHGAVDRLVSASALDQLASLQPGWTTTVMPGVGHSPHMEVPAEVAERIRAFTGALDPAFRPGAALEEVTAS